MNCDVVFYADVQAEGCSFEEDGSYACQPTRDGTCIRGALGRGDCSNGQCASELRLTVTQGAYFDQSAENDADQAGHRRMQMSGDHLHHTIDTHAPTFGTVQRTDRIVIGRSDVEALAAAAWHAAHDAGRRLQSNAGGSHPPTLGEMLVAGSEANALLTTLFFGARRATCGLSALDAARRHRWHRASSAAEARRPLGCRHRYACTDTSGCGPCRAASHRSTARG